MSSQDSFELESPGKKVIHRFSPRLAHPEQANDFQLDVIDIDDAWTEDDLREFAEASLRYTMLTLLLDESDELPCAGL